MMLRLGLSLKHGFASLCIPIQMSRVRNDRNGVRGFQALIAHRWQCFYREGLHEEFHIGKLCGYSAQLCGLS